MTIKQELLEHAGNVIVGVMIGCLVVMTVLTLVSMLVDLRAHPTYRGRSR